MTTNNHPEIVSWNLTGGGNLRCTHCYLDAGATNERELDPEECYRVIDEMSALGTKMVILTGGEPLLRKDLLTIILRCREQGIMTVLGSTVEALLYSSSANLLYCRQPSRLEPGSCQMLDRVPPDVLRELTRQRVEELARHRGQQTVSRSGCGQIQPMGPGRSLSPKRAPLDPSGKGAGRERIPAFIRGAVVQAIERYARIKGAAEITPELVGEAKAYWEKTGDFHLR